MVYEGARGEIGRGGFKDVCGRPGSLSRVAEGQSDRRFGTI
jgi:hypothetical protein